MGIAPIERLPVELLQPIFFDSGYNVALLKASDRIASRLSSVYVYNSICDHYLTKVVDHRAAQSAAQTLIFASKWMTWDFFKSWIIRTFSAKGCLCGRTPEDGCFDEQWPPCFEDATKMVFSRSHLPKIAFVKGRLPKKLLRGPWTRDKVQFLRFLLWITSMSVNWRDPKSSQIALDGRKQAILEHSLEAVELFNHNRRLGKVADLSTLRFAVLEAGCNRSVVYDILLTASLWGRRGLDWECVELDRWCEEQIESGDPKGQWLQMKLDELRVFSTEGEVYENGRVVGSKVGNGELDPTVGDYEAAGDHLVVNKLEWNKEQRQLGWIHRAVRSQSFEYTHGVTWKDVEFFSHFHGTRRRCKGIDTIGLSLWAPLSKYYALKQ